MNGKLAIHEMSNFWVEMVFTATSAIAVGLQSREVRRPEDLVFQGVQHGGPLRDSNILVRFIRPAARSMELPWVNWRGLRTSHAIWLKMAGADVKDAQTQMRHSRSSTTLDIYQRFVPESQQRAVDRLSRLVN